MTEKDSGRAPSFTPDAEAVSQTTVVETDAERAGKAFDYFASLIPKGKRNFYFAAEGGAVSVEHSFLRDDEPYQMRVTLDTGFRETTAIMFRHGVTHLIMKTHHDYSTSVNDIDSKILPLTKEQRERFQADAAENIAGRARTIHEKFQKALTYEI